MTTNQEPENRSINIESGNYNESIQGDNIQGDLIQGSVIYVNKSLFHISSFLGQHTSDVAKLSTQEEYKQRKVLLNKVKNYWIEGVLKKSLHTKVIIELGLEERLEAVEHLGIEELPDKSGQALPTGTGITDVFSRMAEGRTLLILGEPGSGKTTTLLVLAKHLIARTEEDLSRPIPVILNLSSWASKRRTIFDWLIEELSSKYQVSRKFGKKLVQKQDLLLLLDGLDEVKATYREACVQALNQFMQEHGQTEIVVCSRIRDYEVLSTRLQLQGAICVQSLTNDQIKQYLDSAGNQLDALRTLFQKDTVLQELAKSPLTLSVMTLAYEGKSVEDLPKTGSIKDYHRHLFNTYIQQMFSRKGAKKQKYPKEQVMHWLSWLAQQMLQHSQTIFLIEYIQPNWLETRFHKIIYFLCVALIGISIIGLIASLFFQSFTVIIFLVITAGLICIPVFGFSRIKPIESLKWSGKKVINNLIVGTVLGIIFVLCIRVIFSLIFSGPINWNFSDQRTREVFSNGLSLGSTLGLTLGLLRGLSGSHIEMRTIPNQGIWRSAKNSVLFALIEALLIIIISQLLSKLFSTNPPILRWVIWGLGIGLAAGGGEACIKHLTLRMVFYSLGVIPWNYARFLDYATESIFLQKVGGGYIFIHRMLLEHFAQIELTPIQVTPVQSPQLVSNASASANFATLDVNNDKKKPQTPVQNHIVCTNCGHNNPASSNFCTKCGTRLIR